MHETDGCTLFTASLVTAISYAKTSTELLSNLKQLLSTT